VKKKKKGKKSSQMDLGEEEHKNNSIIYVGKPGKGG